MSRLTYEDKLKIKSILSEGLNLNPSINFAYFLDEIDRTSKKTNEIESKLNQIIYNQQILDNKLNQILNSIR